MEPGENELPERDAYVAGFLAGVRARQHQRVLEPMREVSPWVVTAVAFVTGIVLAALLIAAAYLTPPLGR